VSKSTITKTAEAIDTAPSTGVVYASSARGALSPKLANTIASQNTKTTKNGVEIELPDSSIRSQRVCISRSNWAIRVVSSLRCIGSLASNPRIPRSTPPSMSSVTELSRWEPWTGGASVG